jgi:hypothetical protein
MRHAASFVLAGVTGVALAVNATAAHAQSSRDRLPPKQGTVRVAPARPPEQAAPIRGPGSGPPGGGIGHGGHGIYAGYGGTAGWIANAGLQAQLFVPHNQLMRFGLNDRAYVAVFEIQPGRGVRVVFPNDYHAEQPIAPGWHQPPLPTGADALAGLGAPAERGPRWLYLVASDAPLGLVPGRRSVAALQALVGPNTFIASSPYEVASALRQRVLTLGRELPWTDALVAYQPGVQDPLSAGTAPTVLCPNGIRYALGAGENFVCPR